MPVRERAGMVVVDWDSLSTMISIAGERSCIVESRNLMRGSCLGIVFGDWHVILL